MSNTRADCISVDSIFKTTLANSPSCLQFHPQDRNFLVLGTYTLIENFPQSPSQIPDVSQSISPEAPSLIASPPWDQSAQTTKDTSRHSSVDFSETSNTVPGPSPGQSLRGTLVIINVNHDKSLRVRQTTRTSGAVLDLQFSPWAECLLAVAMSGGAIGLYNIPLEGPKAYCEHLRDLMAGTLETSITSLSWHPSRDCALAASSTSGCVDVINPHDNVTSLVIEAHSQEAWYIAWCCDKKNSVDLLCTGGDDSKLNIFRIGPKAVRSDVLSGPIKNGLDEMNLLHTPYESWSEDSRTHQAGVTATLMLTEGVFMSGSYDEYVRLLSTVEGKKRFFIQAEMKLGGGVWRLKKISEKDDRRYGVYSAIILASCMHAGVRVLQIVRNCNGDWTINVKAAFREHLSMNYASECQPQGEEDDKMERTIVSTGFYDKSICVWKIRLGHTDDGTLTVVDGIKSNVDVD